MRACQTEIDKFNNLWFNENEMIQALLPFFLCVTNYSKKRAGRFILIQTARFCPWQKQEYGNESITSLKGADRERKR